VQSVTDGGTTDVTDALLVVLGVQGGTPSEPKNMTWREKTSYECILDFKKHHLTEYK